MTDPLRAACTPTTQQQLSPSYVDSRHYATLSGATTSILLLKHHRGRFEYYHYYGVGGATVGIGVDRRGSDDDLSTSWGTLPIRERGTRVRLGRAWKVGKGARALINHHQRRKGLRWRGGGRGWGGVGEEDGGVPSTTHGLTLTTKEGSDPPHHPWRRLSPQPKWVPRFGDGGGGVPDDDGVEHDDHWWGGRAVVARRRGQLSGRGDG